MTLGRIEKGEELFFTHNRKKDKKGEDDEEEEEDCGAEKKKKSKAIKRNSRASGHKNKNKQRRCRQNKIELMFVLCFRRQN